MFTNIIFSEAKADRGWPIPRDANSKDMPNIAAKHEGGDPDREADMEHPSDIMDYFLPKSEVMEKGLMDALVHNYLEKHYALNLTADALTRAGIGVICAANLHQ